MSCITEEQSPIDNESPSIPTIAVQRPSTDTYDGSATPAGNSRVSLRPDSTTPAQSSRLSLPPVNASQIQDAQNASNTRLHALQSKQSIASGLSTRDSISVKVNPEQLPHRLDSAKKRSRSRRNMGSYEARKRAPWYKRWMSKVRRAFGEKPDEDFPPSAKKARKEQRERQKSQSGSTTKLSSQGKPISDKGKIALASKDQHGNPETTY